MDAEELFAMHDLAAREIEEQYSRDRLSMYERLELGCVIARNRVETEKLVALRAIADTLENFRLNYVFIHE